jgi:hypothetical protein
MGNSRMSKIGKDVLRIKVPLRRFSINLDSNKLSAFQTDKGKILVVIPKHEINTVGVRIPDVDLAVVDLQSYSVGYLKRGHNWGMFYELPGIRATNIENRIKISKWIREFLVYNGGEYVSEIGPEFYIVPMNLGSVLRKLSKLKPEQILITTQNITPNITSEQLEKIIDATRKIL